MYVYFLQASHSKYPNLGILNIFCLKYTPYHLRFWNNYYYNQDCSHTENSGGANDLMFKNTAAKLSKKILSRIVLPTFLKNSRG